MKLHEKMKQTLELAKQAYAIQFPNEEPCWLSINTELVDNAWIVFVHFSSDGADPSTFMFNTDGSLVDGTGSTLYKALCQLYKQIKAIIDDHDCTNKHARIIELQNIIETAQAELIKIRNP